MIQYAVYGASGFAREVMPLVRVQSAGGEDARGCVFVDDAESRQGTRINGTDCISFDELVSGDSDFTRIAVAIAEPSLRRSLVARCQSAGLRFFEVVAPNHIRYDAVEIAPGAIFCANTMVTSNAKIGCHFHCNIYSYVAHNCVIGDFVTFAPRVSCNGNIVIEDGAYIGTGAVLKQGTPNRPLRVGKGAVVGMGAVVTRDVPPGSTVVGNPARPLESRETK